MSSFVRRASSSSIIPLSIRSIVSQISFQRQISLLNVENSFPVGARFLPFVRFSTASADPSGNSPDPVTNNSIVSIISVNPFHYLSSAVDEQKHMPNDFPFEVIDHGGSSVRLKRRYKNELILLKARQGLPGEEGQCLPMVVHVHKGTRTTKFKLFAYPNYIDLLSLSTRDKHGQHLEEFEESLKNRGINSGFINFVSDSFGIKRKNYTRE